ncbi:MAG: methyltransferase domain-containing protein [Burkholderiales bacterium]|nr:methyltransferase domain-containing protein [Bacteroidia bacterium]
MLQRIKNSLKYLVFGSLDRNISSKPDRYCSVCFSTFKDFNPLPLEFLNDLDTNTFKYSIFQGETLNLFNYNCPKCGATDRDRLYALYFELNKDQLKGKKVLNFAPARSLKKNVTSYGATFRTADLFVDGVDVDDKVDIQNMNAYSDQSFDIFVCSHILEHVDNDIAAMKELYRVLSNSGWGIAMVPINLGITEVDENPSIKDEAQRWHHFGQGDHVRMYSKQGFVKRLQSVGFKVEQLDINFFGENVFEKLGLHKRSVLYVVRK